MTKPGRIHYRKGSNNKACGGVVMDVGGLTDDQFKVTCRKCKKVMPRLDCGFEIVRTK